MRTLRDIDTLVVGGGQAGLAMSRCLAERGVEHVVLERGRVGERWRSERWDSLTLLTPRWQSRLPGFHAREGDPHGYMTRDEVVRLLDRYAAAIAAPVESGVAVRAVEAEGARFRVATDRDDWRAANVVIATGDCDRPRVPAMAEQLAPAIRQVVPTRYRSPRELPVGGVLVVGASATGVQLADEIHASGRPVTLAVGSHVRLPRRWRGRDILGWLDAAGVLDESAADVRDLEASRRQPSFQLVGRADRATLDLPALAAKGVRLTGRLAGIDGTRAVFHDDLGASVARADAKLARLVGRLERFVERAGLGREVGPAEPLAPFTPPAAPLALDLAAEGIATVVWATGYRRAYDWLHLPVLDTWGEIRHRGGVVDHPGLYVLGLRFLRRRNSSFLDGVGADAAALADHLVARRTPRPLAA